MNFYQFINILWSRKRIVIFVLMIAVITTLLVSLMMSKQYVARTSIVVNQRSIDPITGLTLPVQLLPSYIATQVDVITSHNVARKVVENLNLGDNEKMRTDFVKSKSTSDIKDWIADSLLKNLEIIPSRESSVMNVEYTSTEPKLASTIANAFGQAYIKTSIEFQAQPAKLNADWFDSQIITLRDQLEKSQSLLSLYQQQHGIVATDDRLDLEAARLTDLSKQLVESQLHTSELQSRKNLLSTTVEQGGSFESLQEVLNSNLIQLLKSELSKAESNFAELSKRVDINHPQYIKSKAEVNSIKQKIHSEINMILSSIKSGLTSAIQRDKLIIDALAEQKSKVLELKQQHDEIRVLSREVENAQHIYDAAMQRAVQSRMESEMSQTNIAILTSALPPQKPNKPKILINIILSIFMGCMLGIGCALLAEIMDRRVRSSFDISELLAIPVLAIVSTSLEEDKQKSSSFIRRFQRLIQ
jgi:chain length determinant protein EpsF